MKKFLLVLGMAACLLGMTACTSKEAPAAADALQVNDQVAESCVQTVHNLDMILKSGMKDQYAAYPVESAALSSWETAQAEIGSTFEVVDYDYTSDADTVTVNVNLKGSEHDAVVTFILDDQYYPTSITTNVVKTFGELMINAGLNTLLGMGTVFAVLILIASLIACFKFIPVLQEKFSRKKKTAAPVVVPAAVPAAEEVSEETDDLELVAVIAAAIAASEGAQSTDGFVVRSIKRRGGKWQRA